MNKRDQNALRKLEKRLGECKSERKNAEHLAPLAPGSPDLREAQWPTARILAAFWRSVNAVAVVVGLASSILANVLALPEPVADSPIVSSEATIFPMTITVRNLGWLPMRDVNWIAVPQKLIYQDNIVVRLLGGVSDFMRSALTVKSIRKDQSSGYSVMKLLSVRKSDQGRYFLCILASPKGRRPWPVCSTDGPNGLVMEPWSERIAQMKELQVANADVLITVRYRIPLFPVEQVYQARFATDHPLGRLSWVSSTVDEPELPNDPGALIFTLNLATGDELRRVTPK